MPPAAVGSAAEFTSAFMIASMNEALLLGSLRQIELAEAAEKLNARLVEEIAARHQTARELAEKARLLDLTHDAIIVRDMNGRISYWNHGAEELYGWSFEEVLGKVSHQILKTVFLHPLKEITAELHQTGCWTGDMIHTKRDGQSVNVLVRKVLDRDSEGNPASVLESITDISARKRTEDTLRQAEAQLADRAVHLERLVTQRTQDLTLAHEQLLGEADARKRLEAEIAGAIEGERERLGQELHDGPVQELTGIAMLLHVLAKKLKTSDPAGAREARRLCRKLENAHRNTRDLAKNFFPVELQHHGLLAALVGIAERTRQQYGLRCMVRTNPGARTTAKDLVSVQLFRIAQEAIQNAAKHAQATRILIRLEKEQGHWLLTVTDDGIGLLNHSPESEGMGLRIMRYRAGIIQGMLAVGNAEGGGVQVSCSAPANEPQ